MLQMSIIEHHQWSQIAPPKPEPQGLPTNGTANHPPLRSTGASRMRRFGVCLQTALSAGDEFGCAAARLCPQSHLLPAADSSVMKRNAPTLP